MDYGQGDIYLPYFEIVRGKYLSLFPAPVQGKVFNFEEFGEEFGGSEQEKGRKFYIFSRSLVKDLKIIVIYEKSPVAVC